jgi:signal transduction histidine kinase
MNIIQSIRFRIIFACIFFSVVVSFCYAWVTFSSLKYNSDELFNWYLTQEAQVLLAKYQQNPHQDFANMTSAHVVISSEKEALAKLTAFFPDNKVKESIAKTSTLNALPLLGPVFTTEQGFTIYEFISKHKTVHVLKASVNSVNKEEYFFYFVDVSDFINYDNNSEKRILDMFFKVLALIFLLSLLIGFWIAKQVVSPLTRLATSVDADNYKAYQPNQGKYFNDEIGFLARRIDSFVNKAHEMINREKAFSRDVSHELRTPLASSRAAIELALVTPAEKPEHLNKYLQRAARANGDMSHLIETFLLLGREKGASNSQTTFNLHQLVEDSFAKHNYLKRDDTVTCINLISPDLTLISSQRYLAIILDNVLRNAFQHTFDGYIKVSCEHSRILIEDTGEGIANSKALVQSDNVLEKSGVGLSIVRRLCEKLAWRFIIDDKYTQGTRVIIEIA